MDISWISCAPQCWQGIRKLLRSEGFCPCVFLLEFAVVGFDSNTVLVWLPPLSRPCHASHVAGCWQLVSAIMVSIKGQRLRRWVARRNVLGTGLIAGHAAGCTLADLAAVVLAYRRAQREVALRLRRSSRIRGSSFNLNAFSSQECLSQFRFLPHHIGELSEKLHVQVTFTYPRYADTPVECLCIALRRLASPSRWLDMEGMFGRSQSALCTIFFATLESILNDWGHLFLGWRGGFMRQRARLYAERIEQAGAALDRCVSFIDGTAIAVARPGGGLQSACYSGHKRRHVLKFQNVLTPDGLFFYLFGPVEGRRHDMTLYYESGLEDTLATELMVEGEQFYLYGDAAYMTRPWLQTAFDGLLTPEQEQHNHTMKVPRVSVEWGFKDVKQACSTLDFPRKLHIRRGPVWLLYKMAVFLWNLRCCLYGSPTATFFKCPAPSLDDYLQGAAHVAEGGADGGHDAGSESVGHARATL